MFKRFLQSVLLAPADAGNGGGGGIGTLAASFFAEQNKEAASESDDSNTEEGDDSGDDEYDDDPDNYNPEDYGERKPTTKEERGGLSAIEYELKKLEDRKKQKAGEKVDPDILDGKDSVKNDEGNKEGDKPKDKSKPKEWDGKSKLTDEELLALDPKTEAGAPVSAKVGDGFNALKGRIKELSQELTTLKANGDPAKISQETETLRTQLTELQTKNAELQKQIDDEYFESSPGFRDTFQKPVDEKIADLRTFFQEYAGEDTAEDQAEIKQLFLKATGFASEGKRSEYLKTMDKLCEEYVTGSTIIKNEFARNAAEYYQAQKALADAMVNKGEERKKLVENKTAERRSKETIGLESDIDKFIRVFESDPNNQMLINSLSKEQAAKFQSAYKDGAKATKAALAQFSATGVLPSQLNEVIARGTAYEALNQKSIVVWNAFMDSINKYKILEEELNTTKKRLSRFVKEPSKTNSSPVRGEPVANNNGKSQSGSRLLDAYQAVIATGRGDD